MAINAGSKDEFVAGLQSRMPLLTSAQAARLKRVIRHAGGAVKGDGAVAAGIAGAMRQVWKGWSFAEKQQPSPD